MDPDATMDMLNAAVAMRDREAVAECAAVLIGWLEKVGFLPRQLMEMEHTRKSALHMLRTVRAVAVLRR